VAWPESSLGSGSGLDVLGRDPPSKLRETCLLAVTERDQFTWTFVSFVSLFNTAVLAISLGLRLDLKVRKIHLSRKYVGL
jgi:hypothetical protein